MLSALNRLVIFVVGVALIGIIFLAWPLITNNGPVKYADIEDHFKYASIGGEPTSGIPYWIWKVLPVMFPDKLPGEGYTSLGFIQEPEQDLPIGFAKRHLSRIGCGDSELRHLSSKVSSNNAGQRPSNYLGHALQYNRSGGDISGSSQKRL